MRKRGRVDSNHPEIMKALKDSAISTVSIASLGGGCGDILAGFRGVNVLLEVKDGEKPPSARELTAAERSFQASWPGQIATVTSPEEAVRAVVDHAKWAGRI